MTGQPDLFDPPRRMPDAPHRRVGGSWWAAQCAKRTRGKTHVRILRWLDVHHGGTRREMEEQLGIKTQTMCPRLWELEHAGLIYKGGLVDGMTVYRLTDDGYGRVR